MGNYCGVCAHGKPIGGRTIYCSKHGENMAELYCCEYWRARAYPKVTAAEFLKTMLQLTPKCDIWVQTDSETHEVDRSDHIFFSKEWEEIRHRFVADASIRYDSDLKRYIWTLKVE